LCYDLGMDRRLLSQIVGYGILVGVVLFGIYVVVITW
jgi:hypothetical protein